jgi:ATP-binding cassette, subfamily C, bacterial
MFTWGEIKNILLESKKTLLRGNLIAILGILLSIPIPLMLPVMVDEVLLEKPALFVSTIDTLFGNGSAFYYIAIILVTVLLLRFVYLAVSVWQTKVFMFISKQITYKMREKLINHLKQVSMNAYETLGSGAVSAHMVTDINTIDSFIESATSKLLASILTLIGVALVIIFIHPVLGFTILIFQPIVMLVTRKISKSVGELKKVENESISEFQQNMGESLELFGQIKASNKENYFFKRLLDQAKTIRDNSHQFGYKSVAAERFSYTVFLSSFELFRAMGLLLVVYSDLSIGMMFAMFGYIWFIMTPIQDILSIQYAFANADAALKRVNSILALEKEPSGSEILSCQKEGIDIVLEDLDFAYKADELVLNNINMHIPAGQNVAIIGSSGSGKTTLAQIIAGFYHKSGGKLFFNGVEMDRLSRQSLREEVFLVLQMPMLFNDTLRFNLTMGEVYEEEEILKALEIAQLSSLVDSLDKGLESLVGRQGVRLSGGQRQRLSIARMILAKPDVVIFDESTSALDVHTEQKLYEELADILKNKTVITIAHRLSTVVNSDMIYVLEDGKVVEQGSPLELEKQLGFYHEFLSVQK